VSLKHGIERRRDGSVRVHLSEPERSILTTAPGQLLGLIQLDDPSVFRLTPPGYADDPTADAEYHQLVGDGLREGRQAALDTLERTAAAKELTEAELESWLGGLESLRLVLGTQLDVTETFDDDRLAESHPDAPRLALYHWLSWLQDEVVHALSYSLPSPRE
jgi:hypothetical protein